MRERPTLIARIRALLRITPAYAGKTIMYSAQILADGDHPRVCGKDISISLLFFFLLGSPPRMRERRLKSIGYKVCDRITPAYAGKTIIERG